jgi:DNA-binding IclR family transcriptional regulator
MTLDHPEGSCILKQPERQATSRGTKDSTEAEVVNPDVRDKDASGVRVIARAFEVLRILALGGERGVRLKDVVTYSGLSRPTVHRILQTLIAEGVGEQDVSTRRYRVGVEISLLGLSRAAPFPVRAAAESHLTALANDMGDTAFLTVRAGWDSVAIDRRTGSYPVKVLAIDVGVRRPLGVGIAGVMLLATLEAAESEYICTMNASRLPADGPAMETILRRVTAARENGFAYAESGVMQGTRALSVPVFDNDGRAIAAISVAAIADRLPESELPRLVETMRAKSVLITRRLDQMQRSPRHRSPGNTKAET